MTQSKHTPAPWNVDNRKWSKDKTPIIRNELGVDVARLSVNQNQIKANAHLIAAAPELLEALEGLLTIVSTNEFCDLMTKEQKQLAHNARKAQAKARGEAR